MGFLAGLQKSPLAWLALAIIAIVSLILAIYYGKKSNKKKKLQYSITSNPLITDSMSNIDGLYVSIDGIQIENLSSTTIFFSNIGNDNIDFSDFSTEKPLVIKVKDGIFTNLKSIDSYVHHRHLKNKNNVNCSELNNNQVIINFEYLNPKDNFYTTFLHTGTIEVQGILKKGVVAPKESKTVNPIRKPIVINLLLILFFALLCFSCNLIYKDNLVNGVYMTLGSILSLILSILIIRILKDF